MMMKAAAAAKMAALSPLWMDVLLSTRYHIHGVNVALTKTHEAIKACLK
jgi:hypothetical protein